MTRRIKPLTIYKVYGLRPLFNLHIRIHRARSGQYYVYMALRCVPVPYGMLEWSYIAHGGVETVKPKVEAHIRSYLKAIRRYL